METNNEDMFPDIEQLRIRPEEVSESQIQSPRNCSKPTSPRQRLISGGFLSGPIPLSWLSAAMRLSGRGPIAIALAIWFEAGRTKSQTVTLTTKLLERFSIHRKVKYRALRQLESVGLIGVERQPQRNPIVTIVNTWSK